MNWYKNSNKKTVSEQSKLISGASIIQCKMKIQNTEVVQEYNVLFLLRVTLQKWLNFCLHELIIGKKVWKIERADLKSPSTSSPRRGLKKP